MTWRLLGSNTACVAPTRSRLGARTFVAAIVVAALATPTAALNAQVIRGVVIDSVSRTPIEGAALWILDATGKPLGGGVIAGDSGRFAIQLPRSGTYRLRVARLGYAARTTDTITVERGATATLHIALDQRAVSLDAVRVSERTAGAGGSGFAGFELRRLRGIGTFITRADIEQQAPLVFMDIVAGVPGVRIVQMSSGRYIVKMNRASPMLRGTARPVELNEVLGEEAGIIAENDCPVIYYLDGIRLNTSSDRSIERVEVIHRLPVGMIEAVEIYRGASELPAEFGGSDARCGVVVVWTKR